MPGVHVAADLVNMVGARGGGDRGPGAGELEAMLREHRIRRPELGEHGAGLLREWGARLRPVFEADGAQERCARVNELLETGTAGVYLTTHDRLRPHLHFTPENEDVVSRVRAVTSGSLAVFCVEAAGERLGVCGWRGCSRVFVDTSRNGRRRYCSVRCGNNDATRRLRVRRGR